MPRSYFPGPVSVFDDILKQRHADDLLEPDMNPLAIASHPKFFCLHDVPLIHGRTLPAIVDICIPEDDEMVNHVLKLPYIQKI